MLQLRFVPAFVILLLLLILTFLHLMAAEAKEFLQRHNLIVELDFRLSQNLITNSWIRSVLRQLFDLLSDSRNLGSIIMLIV